MFSSHLSRTVFHPQAVFQLVLNAAARLLTNIRGQDHFCPVLASLHWSPLSFRIDFKISFKVTQLHCYEPEPQIRRQSSAGCS